MLSMKRKPFLLQCIHLFSIQFCCCCHHHVAAAVFVAQIFYVFLFHLSHDFRCRCVIFSSLHFLRFPFWTHIILFAIGFSWFSVLVNLCSAIHFNSLIEIKFRLQWDLFLQCVKVFCTLEAAHSMQTNNLLNAVQRFILSTRNIFAGLRKQWLQVDFLVCKPTCDTHHTP